MSSSELSNALNPHIVTQKPRRRYAQTASATTLVAPLASAPQPAVPHRSELELAIVPPPHQPQVAAESAETVSVQPTQLSPPALAQSQHPRNAPPVVQQFLSRVVATAREVASAESRRRSAWEREQEVRNMQIQAEMQRRIVDLEHELSMVRACMGMNAQLASVRLPDIQDPTQQLVDTLYSSARIESASPAASSSPPSPSLVSPVSPAPMHAAVQQPMPMFVEGSSSHPIGTRETSFHHSFPIAPHGPSSSTQDIPGGSPLLYPPTPQSSRPSPSPVPYTPAPETNPRKRPREVVEDDTDYDSDTEEESDTPPTDRPLKRKHGHDDRCLTIHHAMRIHIRKMMKLKHAQELPESAFEGGQLPPDQPVRFVWSKTTKQSATNATMKRRILHDLKANRMKYKHVPEKDFGKKCLDAAFEQVFTTLRQKFKAQRDATTATRLKRREDHKAMRARRLHRKKAKLGNRSDARTKFAAFAQPVFDSALTPECMSSEESDDEHGASVDGEPVQAFRTRGLVWRSARLRRFYAVLDEQDRFDKSGRPKRGLGRRVRREGPPKDGIFLPPKGVARWMVSRRWMQEMAAMRPDLADSLRELVVDPEEAEPPEVLLMLGPQEASDEEDMGAAPATFCGHVSETSYSLHNALQPI
ncbi:hypothetical protein C8Q80DRAFT_524321 [Daedaleopsis nitida]|nr:hypothetical protein C8Q80DRAFT_524321 [Daedaleopsis nitida]